MSVSFQQLEAMQKTNFHGILKKNKTFPEPSMKMRCKSSVSLFRLGRLWSCMCDLFWNGLWTLKKDHKGLWSVWSKIYKAETIAPYFCLHLAYLLNIQTRSREKDPPVNMNFSVTLFASKRAQILRTYSVDVSLVQENEEYDIISKAAQSIHGRHLDYECKNVVDECVEGFISQHSPR